MKNDAPDDNHDHDGDNVVAPGPRHPGWARPTPMSQIMATWAPIAAGVIRAVAGLIAFSAALLTLPTHVATPFLTGVGLLMLVGGCVSIMKSCQDEPDLRWFARLFPLGCALAAAAVVVAVLVYGAGAFAPDIMGDPTVKRAPVDDGTVRFQAD